MNTLSKLTLDDLPQAYQIELASHRFPWSQQTFYSNQGEHYINYKIDLHGQMAGFLICQKIADEATLFNIAIHPDFRRQKLAFTLLSHLLTELERDQVKTLWLEVRISNSQAIALYQALGFNEITLRKNYYPTEHAKYEDALIMACSLAL